MPMGAYCDLMHALVVDTVQLWKADDALLAVLREPYWITEDTWVTSAEEEAAWPSPAAVPPPEP